MAIEILYVIVFTLIILLVFVTMDILHFKLKIDTLTTRSIAHVVTSLISLLIPLMFTSIYPVLIITVLFFLLLYFTRNTPILASIHNVKNPSYSDLIIPVMYFICYWASDIMDSEMYFLLPLLIVAISDNTAAHVGKLAPMGYYKVSNIEKTISGSLAFLFSALILSVLTLNVVESVYTPFYRLFLAIIVSVVATFTEALSPRGLDNLTVPAMILIALRIMEYVYTEAY